MWLEISMSDARDFSFPWLCSHRLISRSLVKAIFDRFHPEAIQWKQKKSIMAKWKIKKLDNVRTSLHSFVLHRQHNTCCFAFAFSSFYASFRLSLTPSSDWRNQKIIRCASLWCTRTLIMHFFLLIEQQNIFVFSFSFWFEQSQCQIHEAI